MPDKNELAKYLFFVTAIAVAALILWPHDWRVKTLPANPPISATSKIEPQSRPAVRANSGIVSNVTSSANVAFAGLSTSSTTNAPESRIDLADHTVRIKNPHDKTSIHPLPKLQDHVAAFVASSIAEQEPANAESTTQLNADRSILEPIARATGARREINRAVAPESGTFRSSIAESLARKPGATRNASGSTDVSNSFDAFAKEDWNPDSNATDSYVRTEPNTSEQFASNAAHEALGNQNPIVPTSGFSFDPPAAQSSGPSQSPQGTTSYRLADQPKLGDHYKAETPLIDCNAHQIETLLDDFSPDPVIADYPYDPYLNQNIYQCKQLNANQRPLLEIGRPWYQLGQLSPGSSILGFHNNVNPQFMIFGDYRQAYASNRVNGDSTSQLAFELNTIWNLFITSTERVVWGTAPFDNGAANTHYDFERDSFEVETDFDIDFGYFEGDLGAIFGGFVGKTLPFDAPFAVGLTPILIQNGIWLNDAVEGLFFTIPARSSARFGISNMDISFGFVWDEINSDAFAGDKNAAKAYLVYTFIEALNGYFEIDYAFLEDRSFADRSYHNISMAYSRRFGNFISHSTRVIANAGQEVSSGPQTADGVLLLLENSLITSNPYTVIPYFNMFAGFDTPQSVAGNQQLIATGILFESDGMTDYPTLDTRGSDTFGGAMGLNLLAQDFSQQLIMEVAAVFRGNDSDLTGDQYGVGIRHQIPLNNSWILRSDAMYGFLRGTEDSTGARIELRKKF